MLGSCLLSAFLFSFIAFGAAKTNAEETQYLQLQRDWWQIFPDGNRNAGGPKFFNYALNISKNFTNFKRSINCFVISGSLINPNSIPEFVYIDEEGSLKICGQLYRCCWPCACDVMKHVTAEKFQVKFDNENNEIFLLKIKNPCLKENFPDEVNRTYFCEGDKVNLNNVHGALKKSLLACSTTHMFVPMKSPELIIIKLLGNFVRSETLRRFLKLKEEWVIFLSEQIVILFNRMFKIVAINYQQISVTFN